MFEELHCPFMLLGRVARFEGTKVLSLAAFWIDLSRVQAIVARCELSNHHHLLLHQPNIGVDGLCKRRSLPARLMNNWIMRIPEPMPLGETRLRAIVRAICSADLVKVFGGGAVETVFTFPDQRFRGRCFGISQQ
jgi:hypothetical protein